MSNKFRILTGTIAVATVMAVASTSASAAPYHHYRVSVPHHHHVVVHPHHHHYHR